MKVLIHLKILLLVLIFFLFITPSQSVAYTLDDYSIVGEGNITGFKSEFFSLTATEPISINSGGTSTSSSDLTFTNLSSVDIGSLIITFDGMATSTVILNGGMLETSPGSGIFLNYVSYGGLASGESLTSILSLIAAGNSADGQMTSAKFNIYTIPNIIGPSASTPEPSTYLLIILALLFSNTLILRKRNYDFIGK